MEYYKVKHSNIRMIIDKLELLREESKGVVLDIQELIQNSLIISEEFLNSTEKPTEQGCLETIITFNSLIIKYIDGSIFTFDIKDEIENLKSLI